MGQRCNHLCASKGCLLVHQGLYPLTCSETALAAVLFLLLSYLHHGICDLAALLGGLHGGKQGCEDTLRGLLAIMPNHGSRLEAGRLRQRVGAARADAGEDVVLVQQQAVVGVVDVLDRRSLVHAGEVPDAGQVLQGHLLPLEVRDQVDPIEIVLQARPRPLSSGTRLEASPKRASLHSEGMPSANLSERQRWMDAALVLGCS